ncbi:cdkn1a interacting zinc finger protein 1a isoform X4 [Mustelus asterias]
MFPQQQPQQHFQQQLLQLQQLIHQQRQQQHPHRHPHPHPHPPQGGPGRGVPQQQQHHHPHPQQHPPPPPPPQQQPPQHLNIGPATQPSLINPNPMLHRALIMQQMQGSLRGYGMTAPGLQPFFPPGSRASILGTPPLGIQLQTPRIRFGNQLFQQQHRRFNKDFKRIQDMRRDRYPPREPFRAKVAEKHDANKSNVASVAQESTDDKVADTKKEADCIPLETESSSQTDEPEVKRRRLESENDDDLTNQSGTGEPTTSKSKLQGEDMEKETSECEESGADQNLEHNAANTENFQKHMNGTRHHQRLMEIQQMSNACLATLIPKSGAVGRGRDGDKKRPRWCSTCQAHFRGNVIEHRRTQRHKVKLQRSSQDKDQAGQDDPEDLITVDAVGCFDEDDEEGMTEEDDDSISDCLSDKDSQQALLSEFEQEPYDAEAVYGQEFVVPVTGFLCKLCHKFYHSESTARFTHCKSLMHFQNLQSYKAQRAQDYSSASVQEPAPSGESSLGSTDDHKPGDEKQVETDNKSPEAATSKTQTEQESSESEVQAPSTSGDGTVPQVDKDDASESQCVQLENPSDGTGLISSGTSDCKLSNDEAPNSPKEVVEKMASPDKCEASSVTGNEAVDDEHDGNEECDPSLTKAEEPSEAEDGEEEAITDGCLADKEGEEVNVKGEDTEAELEDDCGHLERNTPKTRSGRAARGRRLSSRRKK